MIVLGHCTATWYTMSRYLVKLMGLENSWEGGRGGGGLVIYDLIVIVYIHVLFSYFCSKI